MNWWLLTIGQLIFYLLVLLYDGYIGSLICAGMIAIGFSLWGVARLAELVEPSKINPSFFPYFMSSWVAPLVAVVLYFLARGGIA